VHWRGKYIKVLDTGGLTFDENVPLESEILKQSEKAMKKADLIVFVTDAKDGILPQEHELAKRIRRIIAKPVIFVANKVDNQDIEYNLHEPEWHKLGLGIPFPVSASNGRNIGDFLDLIYKALKKAKKTPISLKVDEDKAIRVCLIGKPNAGKSSLFNKIIGEDAVIVSDIPHTTREPHDTLIMHENKLINFVDTAGIRRKAKVNGELEREGISKSLRAVQNSDIVLFVNDGKETISSQDKQLGGLLEQRGKSVIILINKWDLAEDNSDSARNNVKRMIYAEFPHLDFAPILFVSGLTGYSVHQIFPLILHAWNGRQTVVPDDALRPFIKRATRAHFPSRGRGTRMPEILALRQLANNPPVMEILVKYRTSLNWSYVNYLENKIREEFDFFATPVIIKIAKMKK
jgi:GTP-binding protein